MIPFIRHINYLIISCFIYYFISECCCSCETLVITELADHDKVFNAANLTQIRRCVMLSLYCVICTELITLYRPTCAFLRISVALPAIRGLALFPATQLCFLPVLQDCFSSILQPCSVLLLQARTKNLSRTVIE